jgi:hypothetical protein
MKVFWGLAGMGRKERVLRTKVHFKYTYEDSIMRLTKHYLERREGKGGNGDIMEGVNLFKVYCMHAQNCHNEILLYC